MDLNRIKQKLSDLESSAKGGGSKHTWSPKPGTHQIRIIPYIHNREYPFIELYFYYDLSKKTIISPISFGKADPVQEYVDYLKNTGEKDDWVTGVKLQAKERIYVPILIRGKEEEGVKFWGFGKKIYQELLKTIDDPDYGDITHPKTGRDITVEVAKVEGKKWNDTVIRIKPKQTPMTESKEVLEMIKEMPDISTLWKEPTYEELKDTLEKYLKNAPDETDEEDETDEDEAPVSKSTSKDPFDEEISEDDVPAAPEPAKKASKSKDKPEPIKKSSSVNDPDFDDLFK